MHQFERIVCDEKLLEFSELVQRVFTKMFVVGLCNLFSSLNFLLIITVLSNKN